MAFGKEEKRQWMKDYNKVHKLKVYYGMSPDDYNKLFTEQKGCCAICGQHQSDFNRPLNVDHCHDTGKIRGLLCTTCNSGIGKLKDSEELLLKAIDYLKTHKNQI